MLQSTERIHLVCTADRCFLKEDADVITKEGEDFKRRGGRFMRKILIGLLIIWTVLFLSQAYAEETILNYRFADADEAAAMLISNRTYYEGLTQNDLNFRMQKQNAELDEMLAFAATQTRDFSDEEKAAIDGTMRAIEKTCLDQGYHLPALDDVVFAKTTMREECDAGAYTHGTQIYLGESVLAFAFEDDPEKIQYFREIIAHELFHCLTRNHPDFRAGMYSILGFTVVDTDYEFGSTISERIISNPDVEHHNSYASFDINGQMRECTVIFTTALPFKEPGDSFFNSMVTGLVPIDDLDTLYTSDEAANFWEVFGRNTPYVIDPEETLADNFSYTLIYGVDDTLYESPEIIQAIDAFLKSAV